MTFKIKETYFSISVYFAAVITFALLFIPHSSVLSTLFFCILHEIGHLTAIILSGCNVSGIFLGPYGMRIEPSKTLKISSIKEIIISLAGPFVNVILMFFGKILHQPMIFKFNTALCLFNLIPIGRTDGYNALYNILTLLFDNRKTETVLKIISTVFLIVTYLMGITVFLNSNYNFSLIASAVYLTIINAVEKEKP